MGPVPSFFERHARLTIAALVLVSVVGTDVVFTHVYRHANPVAPREHHKVRVASEVYHHGLAPLLTLDAEQWGPGVYPYRTNSLGFRDRAPRTVPLQSEKHRILFMGDSFTEGVGVPYEKTFVGIVDQRLRPQGIEVLNAAVSLYSPTIYYRKTRFLLEDVGLRFDEMVVFIDISDIQDEVAFDLDERGNVALDPERRRLEERRNAVYEARWPALAPLNRLLDHNTLLLSRLVALAEAPFATGRHRGAAWTVDRKVFAEYGKEGLERARARMDALFSLLQERGIRLTIAVYPWTDQILARDLDSLQVRYWRAWAAEKKVGFVDYFPEFVRPGRERETVASCFIPGDIHWNEAGHRLVADGFLRDCESRGR